MSKYNISEQYRLYLQRMGLKEETMHPEQKRQLKQAFYGAWGQFLFLMRDDIAAETEDRGVEILDEMKGELTEYWLKQSKQTN